MRYPHIELNIIGTVITDIPQLPKYLVKYTKPNEVRILIKVLDKAYKRLAYVKRLKTGICLKSIGIAGE